jgi:hypothetical protein
MGGMPPPMGPGMGPMQGPMSGPAGMRPMRRGTSKTVPVVVSAGLAVGVFCGLLFGLGTGDDASASTGTGSSVTKDKDTRADVPDVLMAKPADPTTTPPPKREGSADGSAAGSGSAALAAGSNAGSAAGPGAGSAEPAVKMTKLIIEIKPDEAAAAAKITVDGKDTPATSELEMGDEKKKKILIMIKAAGFKDFQHEGEVEGPPSTETKFSFELQKKPKPSGGGGLPRPETPRGNSGGTKPGGKKGGLIDI